MHRGNNRLQREAENNGKDSVGDLRSASWLRGVCVDEKRPQDITGIRPYARMRATDSVATLRPCLGRRSSPHNNRKKA